MASSRGSVLALGLREAEGLGDDPVDVFGLIRALGIRLHMEPTDGTDDDLDGMYLRRRGHSFIYINTGKWPRRQRMTAAHELGHHYLLPEEQTEADIAEVLSADDEAVEEREAYTFARELLMPRTWLESRCRDLPLRDAIRMVVDQFDVSPEAAAVRLARLDLVPAVEKDAFLLAQRDERTRERFGRQRSRAGARVPDEAFARRLAKLAADGVLSEARADELRRHAAPSTIE
jgi:Zn-dependent peptidase ImmA (M78 family)